MRISDWSSDVCSSDLIGPDRPAVERLYLGALDAFAEHALAFAFDRQPVDVATIPSLTVPAEAVAAFARLIFGAVEADESDGLRTILFHLVVARMIHFSLGVDSICIPVAGRPMRGDIAHRTTGSERAGRCQPFFPPR